MARPLHSLGLLLAAGLLAVASLASPAGAYKVEVPPLGPLPYVCVDPFAGADPSQPGELTVTGSFYVCVGDSRYGTTVTRTIGVPYVCHEPEYGVQPNGGGSYHYRLAAPGIGTGPTCVFYLLEGDTPPVHVPDVDACGGPTFYTYDNGYTTHYAIGMRVSVDGGPCTGLWQEGDIPEAGVCGGPYFDWEQWSDEYRYRIGGKVRVGANCIGLVEEGEVPHPFGCDYRADPIFQEYPNADGSRRIVVGATVHHYTASGCASTTRTQAVNVPAPPRVCETAADADPNGDGSYHYRAGASVSPSGGACVGAMPEGNTPAVGVCEGPHLDWEQWSDEYRYRIGGKVRVGNACVGAVQEGEVPHPFGCDYRADPVFQQYPNADGSRRIVVGATVQHYTASGCASTTRTQAVTIPPLPQPYVCDIDYQATPNGDGSFYVRVAVRVSANGGATCTGTDYDTTTPPLDLVCEDPSVDYAPGDDADDFSYDINTGVCLPNQTEPVQKGGYFEGPLL